MYVAGYQWMNQSEGTSSLAHVKENARVLVGIRIPRQARDSESADPEGERAEGRWNSSSSHWLHASHLSPCWQSDGQSRIAP